MLTPVEQRLILQCARQTPSQELMASTRQLLTQSLRWDRVLRAAWQHGVAPLLYKNLKTLGTEEIVPETIQRQLLMLYHRTAYQNRFLLENLAEILRSFVQERVEVLVLKGGYLSQHIYSDAATRPFLDLDLLIHREDRQRAKELLLALGYELVPGILSEGLAWNYHFNFPFSRKGKVNAVVELHWNLTDTFSGAHLAIDSFWSRAHFADLCGQRVRVLCPEDLVIHLGAHLAMHGYLNRAIVEEGEAAVGMFHPFSENRLIWLVDLYEIAVRYGERLDWRAAVSRAKEGRADEALLTTLALVNALFGKAVSPGILTAFPPIRSNWVEKRVLRWLLTHPAEEPGGPGAEASFFKRLLLPKRADVQFRLIRLLSVWEYVFPSFGRLHASQAPARSRALFVAAYAGRVLRSLGHCAAFSCAILICVLRNKFSVKKSTRVRVRGS